MLKLDINLLWTVVNVLVMYAVLRKFLFKPVQDVIAKRQQMVDANLADAETSKKEAAETMNAAQEKLRNVDNEAAARREAYEKQAEVEKQQLLADARKQADAIVAAGMSIIFPAWPGLPFRMPAWGWIMVLPMPLGAVLAPAMGSSMRLPCPMCWNIISRTPRWLRISNGYRG